MQCGGLEWIDGPLHKHSKDDSRQAIGGLKLEIPLWMIDWWGSNGPPQNFGASFCPPSLTAMWKASMLELCGHGWVLLRVLIWRLHQVSSQDHHQKKNLATTSIILFSFFFFFPQHLFCPHVRLEQRHEPLLTMEYWGEKQGVCALLEPRGSRPLSNFNHFGFKSKCHM